MACCLLRVVSVGFTRDRTPPTTPTNLRVTSLSHKSITLAWDPSTDNSGSFSYSVNKDGQNFTVALRGRRTRSTA
jgi:chitinase